ncbi:hypothetical protein F6R98_09490 [Candidatus Methylospira mobilis]|uniref:Glycine zipper family protein n=2 Tax=Candidatus Methylospira mobilis TaxID=1808979 RepID=A0A5Q0BKU3_9GAMM|nr:hypothetical protein F6R98_09490 [Candidatus Methylospira mobilis]
MIVLIGCDGCANTSNNVWKPVVDPYNDPNAARITQDEHECAVLAKQAGDPEASSSNSAVAGGLTRVAGAAVSAVIGNPVAGAVIGAASGGVGAAASGSGAETDYRNALSNCMRQRGHKVIN